MRTNSNNTIQISITNINDNFTKIQGYSNDFFLTFQELINKNTATILFLPTIYKKLYSYTLVLDLDETLVHYVEDEDRPFVQVRPYAAYFLAEMGKYFEIVIFTAAA